MPRASTSRCQFHCGSHPADRRGRSRSLDPVPDLVPRRSRDLEDRRSTRMLFARRRILFIDPSRGPRSSLSQASAKGVFRATGRASWLRRSIPLRAPPGNRGSAVVRAFADPRERRRVKEIRNSGGPRIGQKLCGDGRSIDRQPVTSGPGGTAATLRQAAVLLRDLPRSTIPSEASVAINIGDRFHRSARKSRLSIYGTRYAYLVRPFFQSKANSIRYKLKNILGIKPK
jgi:hypothetical protein